MLLVLNRMPQFPSIGRVGDEKYYGRKWAILNLGPSSVTREVNQLYINFGLEAEEQILLCRIISYYERKSEVFLADDTNNRHC